MSEPARTIVRSFAILCFVVAAWMPRHAGAEPPPSGYAWPVSGPVIQAFEAPPSPFEAGHRGIDIGAPLGTAVRASAGGTVAFAGSVAGSRFVSIDHPDGIRTTYSWLSAIGVRRGQQVTRGEVIGSTGHGHSEIERPHLHFGARRGSEYLDPLVLLGAASPGVRLAPLEEGDPPGRGSDVLRESPAGADAGPWGTAPSNRIHWLWSRTEPKPLVLPGRAPAGGGP